jgi:hypothetical protein
MRIAYQTQRAVMSKSGTLCSRVACLVTLSAGCVLVATMYVNQGSESLGFDMHTVAPRMAMHSYWHAHTGDEAS